MGLYRKPTQRAMISSRLLNVYERLHFPFMILCGEEMRIYWKLDPRFVHFCGRVKGNKREQRK